MMRQVNDLRSEMTRGSIRPADDAPEAPVLSRASPTERALRNCIDLSLGFHAQPGPTPSHLHDVYVTAGLPQFTRHHVGQLSAAAVEAWRSAAEQARQPRRVDAFGDRFEA